MSYVAFLQDLARANGIDTLEEQNALIAEHFDPELPPAAALDTFTTAVTEAAGIEEGS